MRLIDADWVLAALGVFNDRKHGDAHFFNGIASAEEIVEHAPTIATRDWTPCAEGIPEVQKDVHVTILENNGRLTRTEAYIHRFDGVWHYAKSPLQLVAGTVIAWQSYPAPYNPDRKEDAK